jgi:hemolysin activation/secretion protein
MGGSSSVRGLAAARERGEGRLLANLELRAYGLPIWPRQQLYLGGLLFVDGGQIFELEDGPGGSWRRGQGAGLRLHWHSTIVRADYGTSGSRTGLYITFGQVF